MGKIIESSETHASVVVEKFIRDLDVFIREATKNLKNIKMKHQQMNSFWKGVQYDKFTVIVDKSVQDAAKEILELKQLREQLIKKLDLLRRHEELMK